jgi:hypothetical protein
MDAALQRLVWSRAVASCEYCRIPQSYDLLPFCIDHIIAQKHRGQTVADNLALACFNCNTFKGPNIAGIDPLTGELTRLFHPRIDSWLDHFEWHGTELIGRTTIGRATCDVLAINPDRVGLRQSLLDEGWIPA